MRNWLIASILAAGMIAGPAFAGDDHRGRHPVRGYDHPKHYQHWHDDHPGYYRYQGGPRIEHHYYDYGAPRYYYPPRVRYSEPYYYYPRHGGGELELSYRIFLK